MDWIRLIDVNQLNEIEIETKPILIFKHSTTCIISRMVLKQFESSFNFANNIEPYFLDLHQHRKISNEVALRFKVAHQSPQIILIKNGKSVYNTSHDRIDALELKKFL